MIKIKITATEIKEREKEMRTNPSWWKTLLSKKFFKELEEAEKIADKHIQNDFNANSPYGGDKTPKNYDTV